MRVALITDYSDDDEKVDGGVQAVTRYLVGALGRQRDLDLHVIGFKYSIDQSRSVEINGYTRHMLPGAKLGAVSGFREDRRTLHHCLKTVQPDVVHGQGAGHNGIVASRSGYPSVITIHGIMTEEAKYHSGFANRARHRLLSMLSERYCIRRGKHTILISPYVAEYFKDRLSGMQYSIPNPIADSFFSIARREEPGRILFAGKLIPLKGVIDLIRAISKVAISHKLELILAGSLNERQYVDRLRVEAGRLGVDGLVQFRGLLNDEQLRDELGRCAVLVLPSYQETAPMVIVEAMAAGVPVIASDVGGIPQQLENGETGFLVEPGDVNALSRQLIALLSNRSLRESFGTAARNLAMEEYRADRVAQKTVEVYRKILS